MSPRLRPRKSRWRASSFGFPNLGPQARRTRPRPPRSFLSVDPSPPKGTRNAFLHLVLLVAALALAATAAAPGGTRESTASKVVYLTFDDGPAPPYTNRALDLLRKYDAHATFFAVGTQLEAQPALARRIVREGHTIGNHTYRHADLTRVSSRGFFDEVDRMQASLRRITGTATRLLRPPYRAVSSTVYALAAQRGYRIVLWDVDPQDWRGGTAESIAASVLRQTGPGDVVLLHDGGGNRSATVGALERILATLTARGYALRALR